MSLRSVYHYFPSLVRSLFPFCVFFPMELDLFWLLCHGTFYLNLIIYQKIDLLKSNAFIGIETDFKPYSILHFENYRLVYRSEEELLYIISVWDNRQNPSKLKNF